MLYLGLVVELDYFDVVVLIVFWLLLLFGLLDDWLFLWDVV